MRIAQFLVLTPPGVSDPAVAIAACRAGALGVLDFEYQSDVHRARAAIERLGKFAGGDYGVKLGPACGELLRAILADQPYPPKYAILAEADNAALEDGLRCCRQAGVQVLVEVTGLPEAQHGQQLGADGLVLKGYECGGRIGADSSFLLLQRCANRVRLPVWVQGGIGLHTVAACQVAGAAGVVLDSQVLLARESPLHESARGPLTSFDGSQTICVGDRLGRSFRCHYVPRSESLEELRRLEDELLTSEAPREEQLRAWEAAIRSGVCQGRLWPLGQDAVTAAPLAERFHTVSGIVQGLAHSAVQHVAVARQCPPLAPGSLLAGRHGARFPIVQGPMTRVSDTPAFAEAVARAGAVPFLALALLRQAEVVKLLEQTAALLGDRPWGAGILGFAPAEIRQEQFEAIRQFRPPLALIAGGRPDQARQLEQEGIATYLHVPSPELLRLFLQEGARRLIFEGRECGGHVGPRTGFVLWDSACEILLRHLESAGGGDDLHVLFAGGIHDAFSASMVSALAGRLAEKGAAVGVLLGTAYLFTREAVETGAIVPRFQQEALRSENTVLLESGPGHAIRCLPTPYVEFYRREKDRLVAEGRSAAEIRETLEQMNVGRLRIAAKGIDRNPLWQQSQTEPGGNGQVEKHVPVPEDQQYAQGMYMIGQVAPLRREVVGMADLHEDVCCGSSRRLQEQPLTAAEQVRAAPSAEIAIVGMSCFFPQAGSLRAYWRNILECRDAIIEVPPDHWDWRLYFDGDGKGPGKITSKWGGFLGDVPFDPLRYGMPPNSLPSIEPLQLLLLEAVRQALDDAGYRTRPFPRERTAVILGAGGGAAQLSMSYAFQAYLPLLDSVPGLEQAGSEILEKCRPLLPAWTEDTFPGILLNVAAGRVANRFDFGGACFSVDAACGSSLAALYLGVRELQTGASDVAVVMGGDTVQNPFTYMLFSATNTFSPRGRCRPFDQSADGIVISEGIGVVVLKRLADAQRDGDRIYAVVKGVGASSDGKDKGLTAPRPEGQVRAIRRAYANAGVSPDRVGLWEAHGTGTVAGDRSEVESAGRVIQHSAGQPRHCALSSVKSMIGHTKCAAGLAGLINATLALHHKIQPPILIDRPNPKANFSQSPFFLNRRPRPWIHGGTQPRCAGVSAFGFGGTNFHAVLEEYTGDFSAERKCGLPAWPAELFVWRRPTRAALLEDLRKCRQALDTPYPPPLAAMAASLWETAGSDASLPTLAVVASSHEDLREKLAAAAEIADGEEARRHDPRGIYFAEHPGWPGAKIAFLFPGQGAQHPHMLAQLALAFPEVRQSFDQAERVLEGCLEQPLGSLIFPPAAFDAEEEQANAKTLMRADVAQPAVGAACLGMFRLLTNLALAPDVLAGHSYGGLPALCAAGAFGEEQLIRLSHRRGQAMRTATAETSGGMLAVATDRETCQQALAGVDEVCLSNLNGPQQVVISGTEAGLARAAKEFAARGISSHRLDVACPFHSPWIAGARQPWAAALAECPIASPQKPVYSNTTSAPFPAEPAAIANLLVEHVTSPVQFQAEIEAMYAAGARIFIEVGPQGIVTGLVERILGGREHLAVATNLRQREDLVQLQHALAQLVVHGVPVRLDRLFAGRDLTRFRWSQLARQSVTPEYSPSTWLVNSARARPYQAAEPATLAQARTTGGTGSLSASVSAGMSSGLPPPSDAAAWLSAMPAAVSAALRQGSEPIPGDEPARVMLRFQDLMLQFLQTQRAVMEGYFRGPVLPSVGDLPSLSAKGPAAEAMPEPSPTASSEAAQQRLPASSGTPGNGHSPGPAPVAASPPSAGSSPALDRQTITERLLELVSKRTGYPTEMLNLDLNLEADLGIDSIKRVEILSGLVASCGEVGSGGQIEMEKLTSFKSLRDIIDYLLAAGNKTEDRPPAEPAGRPQVTAATSGNGTAARRRDAAEHIRRMLVRPVAIPPPPAEFCRRPSGTLLITDDGRGVATELLRRLRAAGQRAAVVAMPDQQESPLNGERSTADLTDAQAVDEVLARVQGQYGEVCGLVHLLPLAGPATNTQWSGRIAREVKSLFLLARWLARRPAPASLAGRRVLLAATAMGGSFGVDRPLPESFFPGQGGVAGLVKSLAHEWSEALVRVVDFEVQQPPGVLVDRLLGELGDEEGPIEVGYVEGSRITLECVDAPVEAHAGAAPPLDSGCTVLVTGGARGITAAVALELARRYRPRLVLIGRSPLPPPIESAETAGLATAAELKAALAEQLRRRHGRAEPGEIEKLYRRLRCDREIRANLEKLRAAQAEVHYHQVDARDEDAFAAVIRQVEARFGGCDAVIHGAGVIDDKLIGEKIPESFDYVFGTKVESALNLSRLLRPEKLRFCAFFASVAGRFGNRGQSDYAAANEVLSKLAGYLDQRWPGRVVSVVWGPWSEIGMVSELEEHLSQRGLQLIPPEVGPLRFDEEIRFGCKGQSEVVIAGDVGQLGCPQRTRPEYSVQPTE